jgi:putative pantetheine hydrolase
MIVTGARNDITDVAGIAVGQFQRTDDLWLSGTTVVVPREGTVASVDVRGGGPGTRETDCLEPTTMVSSVDAICLSGGSAYGLDTAAGVVRWLVERQRGFSVGPDDHHIVPIVPTAVLFDLGVGGKFQRQPDASFGYAAAQAVSTDAVRQGVVGAGTGARSGGMKGGIGSASAVLDNGVTVGCIVAVNSAGSPVDPRTGELWGVRYGISDEFGGLGTACAAEIEAWANRPTDPPPLNTTLAIVAVDVPLTKTECKRLAAIGHDGMARAINPIHQYTDGDLVFALATGEREFPDPATTNVPKGAIQSGNARVYQLNEIFNAASECVTRAIVHAVLHATSVGQWRSYRDTFPSVFS